MPNRQHGYLLDMLQSMEMIEQYLYGYTQDMFMEDSRTQDAVLRRLLVLGEAAARLTPDTLDLFPDVPFRKIVGMRNRVVQDYGHIDLEIISDVTRDHLPLILDALRVWQEPTTPPGPQSAS